MSDAGSTVAAVKASPPPVAGPPPPAPARKSKKKKGSGASAGENTGRWTAEEHRLFLQGLEQHGKGWKKIASLIKSRTVVQIRTHAQKYFQKLAKARQNGEEGEVTMEGRLSAIRDGTGGPGEHALAGAEHGDLFPMAKRRRPTLAGTKRKAIASVVQSVHKQAKKNTKLPAVAPALANFVVPVGEKNGFAGQNALPASALEDSM
jgi:SHAQKYF class myb-like DNA-binding protein